jgi:hypothetical protein
MADRYRVASKPRKEGAKPNWSDPLGVDAARDAVVRRQKPHHDEGYVMQQLDDNPDEWGPQRTLAEVSDLLPKRYAKLKVGDTWGVKSRKDGFVVLTRKVEIEPPTIHTQGTPAIDKIYTWLHDEFPGQWENWGICVCRRISGSSSWSQHAYCNGLDIHASYSKMDQIAKAAIQATRSHKIPCDQVIWKGWEHIHGGSVYDHYDHVHFTGDPQQSGWPDCA